MTIPNAASLRAAYADNSRRLRICLEHWVSELDWIVVTNAGFVQGLAVREVAEMRGGIVLKEDIVISYITLVRRAEP